MSRFAPRVASRNGGSRARRRTLPLARARGLSLSHATPPRALVATRKGSKSAAGSAERPAEGTGPGGDDEREELDLLYDGILNCYYDPRTNKYYELA